MKHELRIGIAPDVGMKDINTMAEDITSRYKHLSTSIALVKVEDKKTSVLRIDVADDGMTPQLRFYLERAKADNMTQIVEMLETVAKLPKEVQDSAIELIHKMMDAKKKARENGKTE